MDGTANGMRVKSAKGRGNSVSNILYENMVMKNLQSDPITVNMGYGNACAEWTGECALPVFENFAVRNVVSDGSGGSMNFVCLNDSHCVSHPRLILTSHSHLSSSLILIVLTPNPHLILT